MLTPGQVSDLLCLYRLQYTMLAGVAQQRKEVLSQYAHDLAGVSGRRPHSSDGLAFAEKLQTLGLEEYKFHGQVYDAVFYGVSSHWPQCIYIAADVIAVAMLLAANG